MNEEISLNFFTTKSMLRTQLWSNWDQANTRPLLLNWQTVKALVSLRWMTAQTDQRIHYSHRQKQDFNRLNRTKDL